MSIEPHLFGGVFFNLNFLQNHNNTKFSMENTYFKLFCKHGYFKNAFLLINPPKVVSERIKIK